MTRPTSHHERREQIAEAAWRVIQREGIAKVNLREIAREGGYTTGVLSRYFRELQRGHRRSRGRTPGLIDSITVNALGDPERYPPEHQLAVLARALARLGMTQATSPR